MTSEQSVPQFGEAKPGLDYRPRPSAFGLWLGPDGRLAAVRITREDSRVDFDLPGGALDPGESESEALAREFLEETGLAVEPGTLIGRANQYVPDHTSGPVNNLCGFFEIVSAREQGPIQEPDHELVWLTPAEAPAMMYKPAAAWAIRRWLEGAG